MYGFDGGAVVVVYVYEVVAETVAVGWSCAVIVSVPVAVDVFPAVYVIDTVPLLVAPTRAGLFVRCRTDGGTEMSLIAVALPPEPVLESERSRYAPGTGCGTVELSNAVTVKVTSSPVVSVPVVAIGLLENT